MRKTPDIFIFIDTCVKSLFRRLCLYEIIHVLGDMPTKQTLAGILGQNRIKRVKQACLFKVDNPLQDFSKSLVYNRLYYIRPTRYEIRDTNYGL